MQVTRFAEAKRYEAPNHFNMTMVRLLGREACPSDLMWMGVSTIEPGGGITLGASPEEKFYVLLEGELTIENENESHLLQCWDSCRVGGHEKRALKNTSNAPAIVLLAMPLPKAERKEGA